jgi:hypothetical protein
MAREEFTFRYSRRFLAATWFQVSVTLSLESRLGFLRSAFYTYQHDLIPIYNYSYRTPDNKAIRQRIILILQFFSKGFPTVHIL